MSGSKADFEALLKKLAAPPGEPPGVLRLTEGAVVDERYRIVRLLGRGGMGEVYEAEHVKTGRRLALKCLRPELAADRDAVLRLEAEARAAGGIGHENIVSTWDAGELADGRPFLCMELVHGHTLELELSRGPITPRRVVHVVRQLCSALAAAHERGIVHRDVKPANVFLTVRSGDPDYVKLGDFGVAKMLVDHGVRLTSTGHVLGTPHFMAPEQALARSVDARVDVYALGVLSYYALAGRLPFDAPNFTELVVAICKREPVPLAELAPQVPEGLCNVVEMAMAKAPEARFQSCTALEHALAHVAEDVR